MKTMRGLGWPFKQRVKQGIHAIQRSVTLSLGLSLGLSQMLMCAAFASGKVAVVPQSGTYLYGESGIVNQLGQQYVIFAQSGQQVVGAIYSLQSEYSCFVGQRTQSDLTLKIFESATQSQPHSLLQVQLPTLKAIAKISPLDRQVLATCQQEASMLKQDKLAQPNKPIERSKISMQSFSQRGRNR